MEQVTENITLAAGGTPRSFSEDDFATVARVKQWYRTMVQVDCTSCGYCMPCKTGVNIPINFKLYNDVFLFNSPDPSVPLYNLLLTPEQRASSCLECRECEEHCPQGIQIADELKAVHQVLSGQKKPAMKKRKVP